MIIWVGFVVFMLLVLPAGIRICRMLADVRQMAALDTGEIVDGVYGVRDSYVNLYLIKGDKGYVAVDSGIDAQVVRDELAKLNIDPASVVAVFLTHSDTDHTGGLPVFSKAQLFLSMDEEPMVDGRKARFLIFKNRSIPEHELLGDEQVTVIEGITVKAILTPGHTPGSASYLVNGRHLFAGDSMRLQEGKAGIFSKSINMDSEKQLQSLKKLAGMEGVQCVFTAHFGYTDSFEQAFSGFRSSRTCCAKARVD